MVFNKKFTKKLFFKKSLNFVRLTPRVGVRDLKKDGRDTNLAIPDRRDFILVIPDRATL